MPTATCVLPEVEAYAGTARCYQLDPPKTFDGVPCDHVTIWISRQYAFQEPEVHVVPARKDGTSLLPTLKKRAGSYVPHFPPETPEQIDGAFAWALLTMGGYEVA